MNIVSKEDLVSKALQEYAAFRSSYPGTPPPKENATVAESLREYATLLLANRGAVTFWQGRTLDRAYRGCSGIPVDDEVWGEWEASIRKLDWITQDEMVYVQYDDDHCGHGYPKEEASPRSPIASSTLPKSVPLAERAVKAIRTQNQLYGLASKLLRHRGELEDFVHEQFPRLYNKQDFGQFSYATGLNTLVRDVESDRLILTFVERYPSLVERHLDDTKAP